MGWRGRRAAELLGVDPVALVNGMSFRRIKVRDGENEMQKEGRGGGDGVQLCACRMRGGRSRNKYSSSVALECCGLMMLGNVCVARVQVFSLRLSMALHFRGIFNLFSASDAVVVAAGWLPLPWRSFSRA